MALPEPPTLLVGLSAWRLSHARSSAGRHTAPDDCAWAPTADCTFTVSFATRLDADDSAFVEVALQPPASVAGLPIDPAFAPQSVAEIPLAGIPPLLIRIKAEPTARITINGVIGKPQRSDPVNTVGFFEGTAFFVYEGQGIWKRHSRSEEEDERQSADLFAPPMSLAGVLQGPFVFTLIPFFLSRVRERTRQALAAVQSRDGRLEFVDASATFEHIDTPPVRDGLLRTISTKIDLDNDCRVLEVKGFKAPALVAVCWPRKNDREPTTGVAPFLRAAPMESLLFFHASFGQNAAIYNTTPYPFGLEQIDNGLTKYLNPPTSPLRRVYPFGIPYQVAVAGKQTVTILPLNRVAFPELTNLNNGEQAAELFEEIHAAFLRFSGRYFTAPHLGRMALGSFSAAIQELMLFHRAANATPLLKGLIEEVFIFEPIHSNAAQVATYAAAFKSWAGGTAARRVRVYSNEAGPGLSAFVGAALPPTPFVVDSADGRFTTGVVTDRNWQDATTGRDRFLFDLRSPAPVGIVITQTALPGATSVTVDSTRGLKVGDLLGKGAEVVRITNIAGRRLTLDPPILVPWEKDSAAAQLDRFGFRTPLADAVAPGDRAITVADTTGLFADADIIIDRRIVSTVEAIEGPLLRLRGPRLAQPVAPGAPVELFDICIRTALAADHPAGSGILRVTDAGSGFKAGQTIAIGLDDETVRIVAVGADTLELAAPTTRPHRRGVPVGKMGRRILHWGAYHALYVTFMVTDAMRKSGFR